MNDQTPGDRLFQTYCESLGYSTAWEPYPASPRMADFAVFTVDGREVAAEVKSIESGGLLDSLARRGLGRVGTRSIGDAVRPLRKAIKDAAGQLRPLKDTNLPLVVVLVRGPTCGVPMDPVAVISAMYGDLGVEFELGRSSDSHWVTGRDGRLKGGVHSYLSAIVVLKVRRHADDWAESWWSSHPGRNEDRLEFVEQFLESAERDAPDGYDILADVFETVGETAKQLPPDVFAGPRDTRWVPSSDRTSMVRIR